jgi:hypothetical protein
MRLKISILSIAGGLLAAIGVLGYLQQSGSVYPTTNVTILGLVLGVAWGVLAPSIKRTLRWRKMRARASESRA